MQRLIVVASLLMLVEMVACSGTAQKASVNTGSGDQHKTHLYLDVHNKVEGLTAEAVGAAHRKDLETEEKYGVHYLKYWFDEGSGKVFCLVEAPSAEAAARVHKEAHGLVADEITEVKEGE
jgi:hypothetical protein